MKNRNDILFRIYLVTIGIVLYVSGVTYFGLKNDLPKSFLGLLVVFGVVVQLLHVSVLYLELQECKEHERRVNRLNRVSMCSRECTCPKCKILKRRKSFQ